MCSNEESDTSIDVRISDNPDTNLEDSSIDISVDLSNQPGRCGRFECWFTFYVLLLNLIVSLLTYLVLVLVSR